MEEGGEEEWEVGERKIGREGGREGGRRKGKEEERWRKGQGGEKGQEQRRGKTGTLSALSPGASTGPGMEEVLINMTVCGRERRDERLQCWPSWFYLKHCPATGADVWSSHQSIVKYLTWRSSTSSVRHNSPILALLPYHLSRPRSSFSFFPSCRQSKGKHLLLTGSLSLSLSLSSVFLFSCLWESVRHFLCLFAVGPENLWNSLSRGLSLQWHHEAPFARREEPQGDSHWADSACCRAGGF